MGESQFMLTERQLRTHLSAAIHAYVELQVAAPGALFFSEREVETAIRTAVADELGTIKDLLTLEHPHDRERVLE